MRKQCMRFETVLQIYSMCELNLNWLFKKNSKYLMVSVRKTIKGKSVGTNVDLAITNSLDLLQLRFK